MAETTNRDIHGEMSTDEYFGLACIANRPLSVKSIDSEKEHITEVRAKLEAELFELKKRQVQALEQIASHLEDVSTQLRRGIA